MSEHIDMLKNIWLLFFSDKLNNWVWLDVVNYLRKYNYNNFLHDLLHAGENSHLKQEEKKEMLCVDIVTDQGAFLAPPAVCVVMSFSAVVTGAISTDLAVGLRLSSTASVPPVAH